MDFNLSLIRDDLFFDGPISHEVLHIFQYIKNKHDYLQYSYFNKLYNASRNIKKHYNEYNDIEINFTKALYASFPFEQDAMTHCYYTNLFKVNYSGDWEYEEDYFYRSDAHHGPVFDCMRQ